MSFRASFRTHTEKDGTKTLYARFDVPERSGTEIKYRRIERSTRTDKPGEARRVAESIFRGFWNAAYSDKPVAPPDRLSFAAAAKTYLHTKGKNKNYLRPILEYVGHETACDDIDQDYVNELARTLYPDCSAATINRHVFTPIIAVITHAAKNRRCSPHLLTRPEGHGDVPQGLKVPEEEWYQAVFSKSHPHLAVYLLFVRIHGRRVEEALRSKKDVLNRKARTLTVYDLKAKQTIAIPLADPVFEAIEAAERWHAKRDEQKEKKDGRKVRRDPLKHGGNMKDYIFGTCHRSTIRYWLRNACAAAGVEYFMPKEAGRHAFATKTLEEGHSLKELQQRGKWKDLTVPAKWYAHLEVQKIDQQVQVEGAEWFAKLGKTIKGGVKASGAIGHDETRGGNLGDREESDDEIK